MSKEIVVAILIGAVISISAIAFTLIRNKGTVIPVPSPTNTTKATATPENNHTNEYTSVSLSQSGTVVDETLQLTGNIPNAYWVIAYNEEISYVAQSNDGVFDITLELYTQGLNQIKLAAYDVNMNNIYEDEYFVLNSPDLQETFLVGNITDITEESLQIAKSETIYPENEKNEIMLVSFNKDTSLSNEDDEITSEDIGIGDLVIITGNISNKVLQASSIEVIDELIADKSIAMAGIMEASDENMALLNPKEIVIEPVKSATYLQFSGGEFEKIDEIEEGTFDSIIIGSDLGTIFEARHIYLLN